MAPSKRKFYLTRFIVEVLSEGEIPDGVDMRDVMRECDEGEYVLHSTNTESIEHTPKNMAKLLNDAGSDPEFFQLDENGEDLDDPTVIVCKRCGSGLTIDSWCEDDTCPYSDWPQFVDFDLQADDITHALDKAQKRVRD